VFRCYTDDCREDLLLNHLVGACQDRLRLLTDGRVLLTLNTAWADGTRHLLVEPLALLELADRAPPVAALRDINPTAVIGA
jgi:hypothetical protein